MGQSRKRAAAGPVPPACSLPADLQWTRPDHRLALGCDLRGQLVWEGEVSVTKECEQEVPREGGGSAEVTGYTIRNVPPFGQLAYAE